MSGKKIEIRSEAFRVQESEDSNEVIIEGVAVPYERESRNGIIYSKQSIKEAAETLEGKPFLFNHDPNQVLGHVEAVKPQENHLAFRANLNPQKEKVQDIKRGDVKTVSIQAMVEEAEEGEDNRMDVQEFLELSSAPIPGFDEAQATAQSGEEAQEIIIESFDMQLKEQSEQSEQSDWEVQDVDYDLAKRTNWDGVDKEEFPSEEEWRRVHLIRHMDEFHLPIAHYEDEQIKLVYEALNSAFDMIGNIEGIPAEIVNEAKEKLQRIKQDEFPDAEPLDADMEKKSKEPFAGYKSFDDCVSDNQDKEDPEAYCAVIKRKVEDIDENDIKQYNEDDKMSDEDTKQEQDIEDLADALDWVEANAPDEVASMIIDAVRGDEEESESGDEPSESEEEEEERLDKLENKLKEIEKKLSEEDVEESKQPNAGDSKKESLEDVVNEIKNL